MTRPPLTGMRKGELLSLVWRQMRWLQNDLYLPGGKTMARRDRKIPISPTLREILTRRQYGMTQGPNPNGHGPGYALTSSSFSRGSFPIAFPLFSCASRSSYKF